MAGLLDPFLDLWGLAIDDGPAPMVRYQGETFKNAPSGSTKPWNIDAAVAYLIKGPALRLNATYSHTKLGPFAGAVASSNSIELAAQAIFF